MLINTQVTEAHGSTFGETCLATEVQNKFHETEHATLCNARWNLFRIAVAHKFQSNVSTCNIGLKVIDISKTWVKFNPRVSERILK